MNRRQIIFLLLTILWMGLIFSMSNKKGEESGNLSLKVTRIICQVIFPDFDSLDEDGQESLINKLHYPVRKMAHGTEYAILGILLCGTILRNNRMKMRLIIVVLTGILYAVSDEIHQLFISDRAGQITDVLIDSVGVVFGVILVLLAYVFVHRIGKQK